MIILPTELLLDGNLIMPLKLNITTAHSFYKELIDLKRKKFNFIILT